MRFFTILQNIETELIQDEVIDADEPLVEVTNDAYDTNDVDELQAAMVIEIDEHPIIEEEKGKLH